MATYALSDLTAYICFAGQKRVSAAASTNATKCMKHGNTKRRQTWAAVCVFGFAEIAHRNRNHQTTSMHYTMACCFS